MIHNFRKKWGEVVEGFGTVQTQEISLYGKFVTRGWELEKVVFLRDIIGERPLTKRLRIT